MGRQPARRPGLNHACNPHLPGHSLRLADHRRPQHTRRRAPLPRPAAPGPSAPDPPHNRRGDLMQIPRSPRDTFTATRGHGFPIGTAYQVTEPARLAYWAPDEWIEETTSTRRAMACPWSPPVRLMGEPAVPRSFVWTGNPPRWVDPPPELPTLPKRPGKVT